MSGPFLPDRLRPRSPRRRGRSPVVLVLAVAVLPLLAPWWRLRKVDVIPCDGLPGSAVSALHDLEGRFALGVDPRQVASELEAWPGVATVDVRLNLPATLVVRATPVLPHGSVVSGRRWRAVAEDGRLAGSLAQPLAPVLKGFPRDARDLRKGLEIARRIGGASGRQVESVRRITPVDYEVRLASEPAGGVVRIWVGATASAAERYWCRRMANGEDGGGWLDLRRDDRVVVGGVR